MKKTAIIILTLLVWPTLSFGGLYLSPLGFTVNVPSHWKIINSKKLIEDPRSLDVMAKYWKASGFLNEKQIKEMRGLIESGQVEFWIYRDTDSNVNCRRESGNGIVRRSQFKEFEKEARKLYGNEFQILDIGLKNIGGFDCFYWECQGAFYGWKTFQINIQTSSKEYLQFTLSIKESDNYGVLKKEFWSIIASFKPF